MTRRLTVQREKEEEGIETRSTLGGMEIAEILLGRVRFILGISLALAVVVTLLLFLVPNEYESTATVLPGGNGDNFADLKALAGLAGVSVGNESNDELFPTILRSRVIQDPLLEQRFPVITDGDIDSVTMSEYLDEPNRDKLLKRFNTLCDISYDRKLGLTRLTVTTGNPRLSQAIAEELLLRLEDYNLNRRRSQGRENAAYLASQLELQRAELAKHEDSLESFQSRNRDWAATSDATTLKRVVQLQREVEMKSAAVLFLSQQYEIAKFDAQKDIPIVQILDSPTLATVKSGPRRGMLGMLTFLFALCASSSLILLLTLLRRREEEEGEGRFDRLTARLPGPINRVTRYISHSEPPNRDQAVVS